MTRPLPGWASGLALAIALGVAYALTLLPGVGFAGDTAKFQFLGHVLGTPHTTGYPLYVVLNWLAVTLVPVGSLAWKANALSAAFAIGAALLVQALLRGLGVGRWVAWGVSAAWGLTPMLWSQAVVAEVYTLNALFVAGTLAAFLRWERTRRDRDLYLAAGVYALSFGNHLMMIALLPAIALFVALVDRRVFVSWRKVAAIGAIAALGALQYAFVFWRVADPTTAYVEMAPTDLRSFWWYVSGAQFKGQLFASSPEQVLRNRLPWYVRTLFTEFWGVLPLAGAWGATRLNVRQNALLVSAFLGSACFVINYDIVDNQGYFIPSFLIVAVYIALGLDDGLRRLPARLRPWAGPACLALPLAMGLSNAPKVNQAGNVEDARHVEAALRVLGHDAAIASTRYDTYEYVLYYVLGEGAGARGLYATAEPPEAVAAYVTRGAPLHHREMRRDLPPGLAIACITEADREAYTAAGLTATPVAPGVWRLGPGHPKPGSGLSL